MKNINLESIVPILENRKIKDDHEFFIQKLDGIELGVEEKFFMKIPTNTDFLRFIQNENILFETMHTIFRIKNYKKFPLENILPYAKNTHFEFSR